MSLLTSTNLANSTNAHWLANNGTSASPAISGNPVQLCSGFPAPVASSAGGNGTIASSGINLTLGTVSFPSMIGLNQGTGGAPNFIFINESAGMTGTGDSFQIRNTNSLILAAGSSATVSAADGATPAANITVQTGAAINMSAGSSVSVASGADVDFNGAGSQSNTYTATTVVGACPNGVTTNVANPVGLPSGVYAVMMIAPDNDTQFSYQVGTVGIWDGVNWLAGGVGSGHDATGFVALAPVQNRSQLSIQNFLGGAVALSNISVRFQQLAS